MTSATLPSASSLAEWLRHIEGQHPKTIELGLERVARVRDALNLRQTCPVVIVGGTNGKGSTCAMLDAILRAAGYKVGLYTSPHLLRYNERVRVNGAEASDDALARSFARVEAARRDTGDTPLTYFEFGTLGAWIVFAESKLDAIILEVGLGGRLDAVNIFEPDCSILTSIDVDHVDYLGGTREQIGWEKAHIFRAGRPSICGDPMPPKSVLDYAAEIGADLQLPGRDFGYAGDQQQWLFWGRSGKRPGLALPALRGMNQLLNASAVLAALDALRDRLPVAAGDVRRGFSLVELPARFQVLPGRPTVILDVAHNPHAAAVLAANLGNMGFYATTFAVFGMLCDKDIEGVCRALRGRVDKWLIASLPGPRGATADELHRALDAAHAGGEIIEHASIGEAFMQAKSEAGESDRILVFGSFLTVAEVMHVMDAAALKS